MKVSELKKHLARFDDDMEVVATNLNGTVISDINLNGVQSGRLESADRTDRLEISRFMSWYIQSEAAQCAPDNVVVLYLRRRPKS